MGCGASARSIYAVMDEKEQATTLQRAPMSVSKVSIPSWKTTNGRFSGLCELEGKIYAAPFNADHLLVLDTALRTAYGVDVTSVCSSQTKFSGICSLQGKIYAARRDATGLLVFDPRTRAMHPRQVSVQPWFPSLKNQIQGWCDNDKETKRRFTCDENNTAFGKVKGICTLNNKIYCSPFGIIGPSQQEFCQDVSCKNRFCVDAQRARYALPSYCCTAFMEYDPTTDQCSIILMKSSLAYGTNGGTTHDKVEGSPFMSKDMFAQEDMFRGICAMDGLLYAAPYLSKYLEIFKPNGEAVASIDVSALARGRSKFDGICAFGGKVFAAPFCGGVLLAYDSTTSMLSGIDVSSAIAGPLSFQGICALDGGIYACPANSKQMLYYDTVSGVSSGIPLVGFEPCDGQFDGATAFEGKVYAAPSNGKHLLVVSAGTNPYDELDEFNQAIERRYARRRAQIQDKVRQASLRLGVSLEYLLEQFPLEVSRLATDASEPTFNGIASKFAHGPLGKGKHLLCPRDGLPDCSIVDGLPKHSRAKATHFLSWCWAYKVSDFCGGLSNWKRQMLRTDGNTFLWVCFFCNNQYRILEQQTAAGSDDLETTFKQRLLEIGSVVILLDSFANPLYLTRVWCIFETFMAATCSVPVTMVMSDPARDEFAQTLSKGIEHIKSAFRTVNVANARATKPEDEARVKDLIRTTVGMEAVNEKVKENMQALALTELKTYLGNL